MIWLLAVLAVVIVCAVGAKDKKLELISRKSVHRDTGLGSEDYPGGSPFVRFHKENKHGSF